MLFLNVLCNHGNLIDEIIWEEKDWFTPPFPVCLYILNSTIRCMETCEIYTALNASGKGGSLLHSFSSSFLLPREGVGQGLRPRRGSKPEDHLSRASPCQAFLLLFPFTVFPSWVHP